MNCSGQLTQDNFIEIIKCKHRICENCITQIICDNIDENIYCPLRECNNVIDVSIEFKSNLFYKPNLNQFLVNKSLLSLNLI